MPPSPRIAISFTRHDKRSDQHTVNDKISSGIFEVRPRKPNFLLIVILSGVTILLLFLGAYLVLSDSGKKLPPGLHPDAHPTSYPPTPASSRISC